MTKDELDRRFAYYTSASPEQTEAHVHLRAAAKVFARRLIELTPPGREQSLSMTAIEEALMWGNAAIARPRASEGAQ